MTESEDSMRHIEGFVMDFPNRALAFACLEAVTSHRRFMHLRWVLEQRKANEEGYAQLRCLSPTSAQVLNDANMFCQGFNAAWRRRGRRKR